jgi:hypothetical protein
MMNACEDLCEWGDARLGKGARITRIIACCMHQRS